MWLWQLLAGAGTVAWLVWGYPACSWLAGFFSSSVTTTRAANRPSLTMIGLIIGPLFVAAEVAFAMGLRKEVQHAVEAKVPRCFAK